MSKIRILSENVAVRIAAGEVIERPGSVVRELVDNSIDAGATRVAVRIERGGKSLIKVIDNGVGMSRDDLLLCTERHATSKIHDAEDLTAISSLGFRGEALASIAAVSRLSITTRQRDDLVGNRLIVFGGKIQKVEEVGTPQGTVVEVRDLFYNVPARKKFLRSPGVELNNVVDVFARLSLGFESIHFSLENEQKTILNLPPLPELIPRLAAILGRTTAEQMAFVSRNFPGTRVKAYLAPPDLARTRPDRLFVYVNRRNVRDKLVNKAVIEGYGGRLMKGVYPQAVVFIEIDPGLVDINVHPAKQEVRFQDPGALFKKIMQTVDEGLGNKIYSHAIAEQANDGGEISEPIQMNWGALATSTPAFISGSEAGVFKDHGPVQIFEEEVRVVGQLRNMYILCEGKDGLIIVDQHAAHERVLYESLMEGIRKGGLEIQRLLLPKTIELGIGEKRVLEEKGQALADLGVEIEDFGGQAVLLRCVPSLLGNADWETLLPELVSALEQGRGERDVLMGEVASLMACHAAIRAGYPMSVEEMQTLLDQLSLASLPTNCPHGRPIFRKITYYELEKMFKRVV